MKRRTVLTYLALCLASATVACSRPAKPPVAELPTIQLAITDVSGLDGLETDYEEFRLAVADALGTEVEFYPVENSAEATVALKQGEIDLALAGPSEYVVISARTNAVPVIAVTRPNYRSVIAVPANSDIASVADLKGKAIALSDIGSTSGHVGPTYILIEGGLDPKADITTEMLGDDGSAAALKAGEVEAWGGSATDFADLVDDGTGAFKVLVEGNLLPSDLLIASSSVDPATVELIQERLLAHERELTTAIAAHESKYVGSTLQPATDADYDPIRAVYQAIGQGEFVQ